MIGSDADQPGGSWPPAHGWGGIRFEDDLQRVFPAAVSADLCLAVMAALTGGLAALPYYRSASLRSTEKTPGDPVTEADHASNDAIVALLRDQASSDPVLSEEAPPPDQSTASGRLWVVDPLDGTREFMDGIDEFAAMVGLAEAGSAVLGAVFVAGTGILYAGCAAGGAWVASCEVDGNAGTIVMGKFRELRVAAAVPRHTRLVRSRSHPDARLQAIEDELPGLEIIPSGSVGVKCARIGEGEADLYVHPVPYLKEWDTCAPEAVLRGAGGIVTDCSGVELRYGKPDPRQPGGILAGSPQSWEAALPLVRKVTAAMF